jgi:uncharacterized membrane protein YsdA (DUF1294 family)/cold shock CspA family protein
MQKGRLIKWFDEKGYGFIRPNSGGDDVFLHIQDVISHTKRDPKPGDTFIYDIEIDDEGRTRAIKASITGLAFSGFTILGVLAALGFIVYLALVFFRYVPLYPIAAIYVGMSLLTIWVYSRDKRAAKLGRWRTREIRLHLLELLGGWPGAFLAQRFYRHKSRKLSYQFWFWAIILVHALAWYQVLAPAAWSIPHMPSGQQIRQIVTSLVDSLPGDVVSTSDEGSFSANQPSSATQAGSAEISCPDSRDNVKVFTGTVISVSSRTGLIIRFSSTSDGTIQPSALPANFARLFNKGDQVCVSIKQALIENDQKHYELALIE